MDRIDELLIELCGAQNVATEHRINDERELRREAIGRRDAFWKRVTGDWREMVGAVDATLEAVKDDPSLQEQLVIAHFSGDENLAFAKAIRQLDAALSRIRGESDE